MKPLTCSVAGCTRPVGVRKHRLCTAHYQQFRRHGRILSATIARRRPLRPYKETRA